MNSPADELSMREQAEEESRKRSEMAGSEMPRLPKGIRLLEEHIALLGIKEKLAKKEAALLTGAASTGVESSMRKQAKKESGKKSELQHLGKEHMMIYFSILSPVLQKRAIKHYYWRKYEVAERKASFAKAEKRKALLASKEKSARREKAKAKAKAKAKVKAMANVNEETGSELGKMLEEMRGITAEGDYFPKERTLLDIQEKLAKEKNNNPDKETLQHLLKYMFDRSNDKKISTNKELAKMKDEEAGKAEVSVTEAGRPEESVLGTGRPEESATEVLKAEESDTVGSGKSSELATNQEVISPEMEESVTKSEEALKEAEKGTGGEPFMRKEESGKKPEMQRNEEEPTGPEEFMGNYYSPQYWDQLMEHREAPVTEMDDVGRGKLAIEEHLPMVDFEVKSEMETEAGKAEEAVVDMNSEGGDSFIREEAKNELGKRLEKMGIRPEMQLSCQEDYIPTGIQRALLDNQEKFAKKRALRLLVKDLSDKFDITMGSMSAIEEHAPMVKSDKLLIEHADPDSVTRLGQCSVQDFLDHERAKSATALAKKMADEMAEEAKDFYLYSRRWESTWIETCGPFDFTTLLSSMQFTRYTPGRLPPNIAASTPATLQIISIKLAEVAAGLHWPLSVFGVVAVRDVVDHNRNFLFSCDRENSQELTQDDPFLRLIGPSRAVVYTDRVNFEIQLYVKGTTESQDKALITQARGYRKPFGDTSTVCFKNCFCMIELRVQVVETTTQATILGVQADISTGRPYPFEYGARVTCSPLPGKSKYPSKKIGKSNYTEIVMVDSKDGEMLKGSDGYLHLPRDVISVECQGRLDVEIQAYSKSGAHAAKEHVSFLPRLSKISRRCCTIRGVKVVITVAWSRVAKDKHDVMTLGSLV